MSHHSPTVRAPVLYLACLTANSGPIRLLEPIAEAVTKGRVFAPSQAKLGELMHKDRRTIIRWAKELKERGWVRVIRRGKKLTNIYLLSRALWRRLTGQVAPKFTSELQGTLYRLGLYAKVSPGSMLRAGVRPAS